MNKDFACVTLVSAIGLAVCVFAALVQPDAESPSYAGTPMALSQSGNK